MHICQGVGGFKRGSFQSNLLFLLSCLLIILHDLLFQASCEIKNGDQSVQSCVEFNVNDSKSWLYIEREHDPPRCFLEIVELQREHNGTYSCFFEDTLSLDRSEVMVEDTNNNEKLLSSDKKPKTWEAEDHHRIVPSPLIHHQHQLIHHQHRIPSSLTKYFTLTVLQWPSGILVRQCLFQPVIRPAAFPT